MGPIEFVVAVGRYHECRNRLDPATQRAQHVERCFVRPVQVLQDDDGAPALLGCADLAQVKHATARYHSVAVAERAGYGRFVDVNGVACIDMPGMGAMGVHYVDASLVGDGKVDALTPEAVVYEPGRAGHLHLVAVEYVVIQHAWDARHRHPPALFGHQFDFTGSPNRDGLPPFYSLHAWVWQHNPAGTFAMWNPRVSCTADHAG